MKVQTILPFLAVAGGVLAAFACGSKAEDEATGPGPGVAGTFNTPAPVPTFAPVDAIVVNPNVFPAEPILDVGVDPGAASAFASAAPGGPAPCLVEPTAGTLFPRNWLRARLQVRAAADQDLFEFKLTAEGQNHPLVVYTKDPNYKLPKDLWDQMSASVVDTRVTVEVRALASATKVVSAVATGDLTVAPVKAPGSIVYWQIVNGKSETDFTSELRGFKVGEEGTVPVLKFEQIQMDMYTGVTCIGCHTSTPDGEYLSIATEKGSSYGLGLASGKPEAVGAKPPWLTDAAIEVIRGISGGIHTYSPAHWRTGDRVALGRVSHPETDQVMLAALDLEATDKSKVVSFLERRGDSRPMIAPTWSRDGKTIIYTSADSGPEGLRLQGEVDLYSVPYNDRKGGDATPLAGASAPGVNEYYPSYSPDDALVVFNQSPVGEGEKWGSIYSATGAELWVIPPAGGTATRLAANDPATCTGDTSPGLSNSWAHFSPEVGAYQGKKYYFYTFSSKRQPLPGVHQLYLGAVIVEGDKVSSTPGIHFWNQPAGDSNHTPTWDVTKIADFVPGG